MHASLMPQTILYSMYVSLGISQLFDQMVSRDDQKRKDRCLGDQVVMRLFVSDVVSTDIGVCVV